MTSAVTTKVPRQAVAGVRETSVNWGEIQGVVAVPDVVLQAAAGFAVDLYRAAEGIEFSGDPVETLATPGWCGSIDGWLPTVEHLGFEARTSSAELVATVGVEQHVDGIHGPTLFVVLHNDGLTFRQGRSQHKTVAGQWFIFDDGRRHGVRESPRSTAYVGVAVPLSAVG